MNEKELLQIIGNNDNSAYALITSMLTAASIQNSNLTKEQKEERAEARQKREEERIRQAKIIKGICPECEGKLVRGKKDKKKDYKRIWTCGDCGSNHSI